MHLLLTITAMVITRQNLRGLYLEDVFTLDQLTLSPQYGMMVLFLVVFAVGLGVVAYLIKTVYSLELKGGRS
jgi:hypothetical protein